MVDGQLTHPGRHIVAVDLDGTIIAGNTLRIYIAEGLRIMARRNPMRAAAIATLVALRKLRFISHRRMKFAALKRIKPDDVLRERFIRRFDSLRRPEVAEILDRYRHEGATILLATAAADIYIPWIWNEPYVATPTADNPERIECRGQAKMLAVKRFMQSDDILEAVITDHADDLALLSAGAVTNYLVDPDTHTLNAVKMAGIEARLIASRH